MLGQKVWRIEYFLFSLFSFQLPETGYRDGAPGESRPRHPETKPEKGYEAGLHRLRERVRDICLSVSTASEDGAILKRGFDVDERTS